MSLPDGKLLFTNGEAREMLGCGNTKLYELLNGGYLDSVPFGVRGKRITRESIERLLQGKPTRRPTLTVSKAAEVSPPANDTNSATPIARVLLKRPS